VSWVPRRVLSFKGSEKCKWDSVRPLHNPTLGQEEGKRRGERLELTKDKSQKMRRGKGGTREFDIWGASNLLGQLGKVNCSSEYRGEEEAKVIRV